MNCRVMKEGQFLDHEFVIVSCNIFGEGPPPKKQVYPAEIGAVGFTLRGGIGRYYDALIDPGDIHPSVM